jgi:GntR family transcriptional regulator/MocR family aminotransferase
MIAAPRGPTERRVPRRVRVYCTVIDAIRSGALPPGARLPSARQLAKDWGYARGAVEDAFAQLQIEGLIERRVGDGSYVALTPVAAQRSTPVAAARPLSRSAQQVLDRFAVYLGKPRQLELPHAMLVEQPLFPRAPMTGEFPLEVWRKLVSRAHGEAYRDHMTYGPAAGLPRLREAIARHLSLARATPVQAQQVIVLHSPTQAVELISRVLLEPADKVWLEDPGHSGMIALFQVLRHQVIGVPLDDQGLDVEAGKVLAPDAALVYFHPITQYPLAVRTSPARRAELLRWAEASGAWVVEGNFNDEVVYDRESPGTLWNMDESERVLMMGTFEGIMYPSLRVAYLVVPQRLVDVFIAMRGLLGDSTNTQLQLALAWFIDEGHLATHLRNLRERGRERRDALSASCARHLPPWARLGPLAGGLTGSIHIPAAMSDREVVRRLRDKGVLAIALSSSCIDARHGNGLVVGFGAFDPFTIDRAIAVVGQSLREVAALARSQPDAPPHQRADENR